MCGEHNRTTTILARLTNSVWGMLEYLGQDPKTAPKYQALIRYIDANPTSK